MPRWPFCPRRHSRPKDVSPSPLPRHRPAGRFPDAAQLVPHGLPVHFSYLDFGIGGQSQPIGSTSVDLGVKGSAFSPVFARQKWITPDAPGHYLYSPLLPSPNGLNGYPTTAGAFDTSCLPLYSPFWRKSISAPGWPGGGWEYDNES